MGRKTSIIPKATVARLIMHAGAKRVSSEAVDEFTEFLTDKALKISTMAAQISKHSKRKTVVDGDVKLASK